MDTNYLRVIVKKDLSLDCHATAVAKKGLTAPVGTQVAPETKCHQKLLKRLNRKPSDMHLNSLAW